MSQDAKLKYPAIVIICFPFVLMATISLVLAGLGTLLGDSGDARGDGIWRYLWLLGGYIFTLQLYTKVRFFKSFAHTEANLGSKVWIAWLIALLTWPALLIFTHKFTYDTLGWNASPHWYKHGHFILGMFGAVLGGWWVFRSR